MRFAPVPLALAAAFLVAAPASGSALPAFQDAPPPRAQDLERPVVNSFKRDQERAFERQRRGDAMRLPQIERQIVPRMRGYEYLGPETNGDLYRLKFVRDGRVVWVDVDPRTGRVVRTSRR